MSWWRAYDEAVDDPKLQRMPGDLFKAWFNVVCIASSNGGWLPPIEDIAFKLRLPEKRCQAILDDLLQRNLLDEYDGRFTPHNWNGRQYKSDVSTERVQRFRKRQPKRHETVSRNAPETEQRQNRESTPSAGADAPRDIRAELFGRGLEKLAEMTGKTPTSCRSTLGRWLKDTDDEAVSVLGAIDDAAQNRVAEPIAWITATLKSRRNGGQSAENRSVHAAAGRLVDRIRQFDADLTGDGSEPRPTHVRLLSQG